MTKEIHKYTTIEEFGTTMPIVTMDDLNGFTDEIKGFYKFIGIHTSVTGERFSVFCNNEDHYPVICAVIV